NSNEGVVRITVNDVNDPPVAAADSASTPEGVAVTVQVLANDSDDGALNTSSVAITQPASSGSTQIDPASGAITYTPNAGFSGRDTLAYTVQDTQGLTSNSASVFITVIDVNIEPVAAADSSQTPEDTPVTIDVAGNDSDADGSLDLTSVTVVVNPVNGTASVNPVTGALSYTPGSDFFGEDSLRYTIHDDLGASSQPALVHITVTPVNDAPVAQDDAETTSENTPITIVVLQNDGDVDSQLDSTSVNLTTPPVNGSAQVDATTGTVTYTPNFNVAGTDSFAYTVKDVDGATSNVAKVSITIVDQNNIPVAANDTVQTTEDAPVTIALLSNDTDSDGSLDPASVAIIAGPDSGGVVVDTSSGQATYTPNPNFFGSDSFTYRVKDNLGASSNVATVAITV
ncbi:MAG: tandem-95 repeat protein, partial [Candidatus Zixiibacteriota bacterium]